MIFFLYFIINSINIWFFFWKTSMLSSRFNSFNIIFLKSKNFFPMLCFPIIVPWKVTILEVFVNRESWHAFSLLYYLTFSMKWISFTCLKKETFCSREVKKKKEWEKKKEFCCISSSSCVFFSPTIVLEAIYFFSLLSWEFFFPFACVFLSSISLRQCVL